MNEYSVKYFSSVLAASKPRGSTIVRGVVLSLYYPSYDRCTAEAFTLAKIEENYLMEYKVKT